MGAFKYIKKIVNFYGKGKHKYIYKTRKVVMTKARIKPTKLTSRQKGAELAMKREFSDIAKARRGTSPAEQARYAKPPRSAKWVSRYLSEAEHDLWYLKKQIRRGVSGAKAATKRQEAKVRALQKELSKL